MDLDQEKVLKANVSKKNSNLLTSQQETSLELNEKLQDQSMEKLLKKTSWKEKSFQVKLQ